MRFALTTCAVGLSLCSAAQAAIFSFASDVNAANWTFSRGASGGQFIQGPPAGPNTFQLLVNDDNHGNTAAFNVAFNANLVLSNALNPVPGVFIYRIDGTFSFLNADNSALLTVTIVNGLYSALGVSTRDLNRWGSTSTIQANDDAGSVTYQWFGADLPTQGVYGGVNGVSVNPDDAGFSLTFLNTSGILPVGSAGSTGVVLDANLYPVSQWYSEGSYSGTAFFGPPVPTPGTAVLGIAALVIGGRRNRR